ncbi:MAG TPA: hypothetical protein VLG38_07785 [Gammaproteobacteria bacterium]|nr:hypothetical protein [Gammaproteobacteria bacterium]
MSNLKVDDAKSYAFYCAFLEQFVQGFYDVIQTRKWDMPLDERLLHMQALRRLYLKLLVVQDRDSDYKTCMTSLELAFDEVANLLAIVQPYSKDDLFDSLTPSPA